jgi:hypothetical protein
MTEAGMPESGGSCGCGRSCGCEAEDEGRELVVVWQRLLDQGTTCPRCGSTQQAVRQAVEVLAEALRPIGFEVTLEERALDRATFQGAPGESNRIWIAGRPLEDWLGATAGASTCCSVCGDDECRTLEVDGSTFEVVPEPLIVKAGLAAAASLLTA